MFRDIKDIELPSNLLKLITVGSLEDFKIGLELVEVKFPGIWEKEIQEHTHVYHYNPNLRQGVLEYPYKIGNINIAIGSVAIWKVH